VSDVTKHLEIIQSVINRQAANSFQMKSWTIALLAALIGLSRASKEDIFIAGLGVVILFWLLDSYYLSKERKFRSLYDEVRQKKKADYSMDISKFNHYKCSWWYSALRPVELLPYGAMLAGILIFTVAK